jgi:hypothetical protein
MAAAAPDPYAPPGAPVEVKSTPVNKPIPVPLGVELPRICAKCGSTDEVTPHLHRFAHVLPLLTLLILVVIFFGNMIARKVFGLEKLPEDIRGLSWLLFYGFSAYASGRVSVNLPLCDRCEKAWRRSSRGAAIARVLGVLLLGVLPLARQHLPESVMSYFPRSLTALGWLAFWASLAFSSTKARLVAGKYDNAQVSLFGLHPAAAEAYQRHA